MNPTIQFRVQLESSVLNSLTPDDFIGSNTLQVWGGGAAYERWHLSFVGDTDCLPDTIPVTATQDYGGLMYNRWVGSDDGNSLNLDFPPTGGSIGVGGTISDSGANNFPEVAPMPDAGSGTLTLTATNVQTMVVTVHYSD